MSIHKDQPYLHGLSLTNSANRVHLVTLPKKGKKTLTNHEIDHDFNGLLWCGLAVISALTGVPTSTARDLVKSFRKNPQSIVTGTTEYDVDYVLKRLGYKMEYCCLYGGKEKNAQPTLSRWLEETKKERVPDVGYLISFVKTKNDPSGHWGLILNGRYICSFSQTWVELKKAPFRRRKIDNVFAIQRVK